MKISFVGDLFLGGDLKNQSCADAIHSDLFEKANYRVINLEQAVSDSNFVEDKCTLYTGTEAISQLKEMKIDAINLAHNHIQDKGLGGIDETVAHLQQAGFNTFGAGKSIKEASYHVEITENLVLLGYCEFGKPYLKQIEVATENKPGINPLRYNKIRADLSKLAPRQKAILYFHWGMEHVWLPPADDILLAKQLLEDERVTAIIGMHCHRVQGVIAHNGKKAYMSLGNFLFPNFYINPPTQIAYPSEAEKQEVKFTTRQYHGVYELTYKKWRWVNRVSRVLSYDTESNKFTSEFVIQKDNEPKVVPRKGVMLVVFCCWTWLLTLIYKLPMIIYRPLSRLHAFQTYFFWRLQIRWFHMRQLGLKMFASKIWKKIKEKVSR